MTMSVKEKTLLHSQLERADRYLEFGAGESTRYAAGLGNLKSIEVVESSPEFFEFKVAVDPTVRSAMAVGRIRVYLIDLGPLKEWGEPTDKSCRHLWPNYSLAVFSKPSNHDLVLIDGRFRVACALSALLNTPDYCQILIHDFSFRPEYKVLLEFFDVQQEVDSFVLLSKKVSVNRRKVQRLVRKYQYLPRDKTVLCLVRQRILASFTKMRSYRFI